MIENGQVKMNVINFFRNNVAPGMVASFREKRQALGDYDREIRVKSWPELQKKLLLGYYWVIIVKKLLFSHRTAQWKVSFVFPEGSCCAPENEKKASK